MLLLVCYSFVSKLNCIYEPYDFNGYIPDFIIKDTKCGNVKNLFIEVKSDKNTSEYDNYYNKALEYQESAEPTLLAKIYFNKGILVCYFVHFGSRESFYLGVDSFQAGLNIPDIGNGISKKLINPIFAKKRKSDYILSTHWWPGGMKKSNPALLLPGGCPIGAPPFGGPPLAGGGMPSCLQTSPACMVLAFLKSPMFCCKIIRCSVSRV